MRAFPSALLRLAKDAPARRRVRSMKPRVFPRDAFAKDPRGATETGLRAFSDGIRPLGMLRFFRFKKCNSANNKQKKHNRSHKRAGRFSLPNVLFVARPQKHAEKLSYFFESALESARRPSFSSSREGGFFACGRQRCCVTSDDEVNSSLEESGVFLLLAFQKREAKL